MTERTIHFTLEDRLNRSMRQAGLDRNDMADRLRRHRDHISRYLNGQATPDYAVLFLWAHVTGVDLDELIGDALDTHVDGRTKPSAGSAGAALPLPEQPGQPTRTRVTRTNAKPGRSSRSARNRRSSESVRYPYQAPFQSRRPGRPPRQPPRRRAA